MEIFSFIIILNCISICIFSSKYTFEFVFHVVRNTKVYYNLTRRRLWVVFSLYLSVILLMTVGYLYTILYVLFSFWYYDDSLSNQLKIAIKHPLMNPEIRGLSYHIPLAIKKNQNVENVYKFQNKIFWSDFFLQHNIYSPQIFGFVENGILTLDKNLERGTKYIIKRIQDTGGSNAQILNENRLPKESKYIVQNYVKSYKGIAENWRITTLVPYNGGEPVVYDVLLTINNNPNDVKTNCNTFYKNYEINDDKMRYIKSNESLIHDYDNKLLLLAKKQAIELHNKLKKDLICIGWDIIMSNNGPCFLEGNIAPGLLRRNDIYFYRKIRKYLLEL